MKNLKTIIVVVATIVLTPTLVSMIGIWWLETRFGKEVAALAFGGMVVMLIIIITAIIFLVIFYFAMSASTHNLKSIAAFMRSVKEPKKPKEREDGFIEITARSELGGGGSLLENKLIRQRLLTTQEEPEDGNWKFVEDEDFVFVE